jgi:hypothetical protein
VVHSVNFVSLKQAMAMNGPSNYRQEEMAMNGPSNYGQEGIVQFQITLLQKIENIISILIQKSDWFLKKRKLISDPEQWKIGLSLEIEEFETEYKELVSQLHEILPIIKDFPIFQFFQLSNIILNVAEMVKIHYQQISSWLRKAIGFIAPTEQQKNDLLFELALLVAKQDQQANAELTKLLQLLDQDSINTQNPQVNAGLEKIFQQLITWLERTTVLIPQQNPQVNAGLVKISQQFNAWLKGMLALIPQRNPQENTYSGEHEHQGNAHLTKLQQQEISFYQILERLLPQWQAKKVPPNSCLQVKAMYFFSGLFFSIPSERDIILSSKAKVPESEIEQEDVQFSETKILIFFQELGILESKIEKEDAQFSEIKMLILDPCQWGDNLLSKIDALMQEYLSAVKPFYELLTESLKKMLPDSFCIKFNYWLNSIAMIRTHYWQIRNWLSKTITLKAFRKKSDLLSEIKELIAQQDDFIIKILKERKNPQENTQSAELQQKENALAHETTTLRISEQKR